MTIEPTVRRLVILALGVAAALGCSAVDEISNKIDCHSVCKRYSDCFDADYDVSACTDKCESDANSSQDRDARLERCDNCIDDRSCTDATFNCASDCAGIVP